MRIAQLLRTTTAGLAALILTACSTVQTHRPRVAPTPVPQERIDRLTGLLIDEWERWGGRVARLSPGTPFCLVLETGQCSTVEDGCGQEQQPGLCQAVNEYWDVLPPEGSATHTCMPAPVCEARWPAFVDDFFRPWTPPWSAAFISAMMMKAGFTDREFAFDSSHVNYVIAARDHTASAYELVPVPAVARPGDLICAVRGITDLGPHQLAQLQGGTQGASQMHCDIVVATDPGSRTLEAIGGNVQQTVAKTLVTLDELGRVAHDLHPDRPWVAVMRARRQAGDALGTIAGLDAP